MADNDCPNTHKYVGGKKVPCDACRTPRETLLEKVFPGVEAVPTARSADSDALFRECVSLGADPAAAAGWPDVKRADFIRERSNNYGTVAHVPVERVAMPEELETCYREIAYVSDPSYLSAEGAGPTEWEYYLPRCAPEVWPFLSVEQKATMYFMALAQAERFRKDYNSVR